MNIFYKNTVVSHLHKLISEKEYYMIQSKIVHFPPNQREGYELMAEFYEALILAAKNHITWSLEDEN